MAAPRKAKGKGGHFRVCKEFVAVLNKVGQIGKLEVSETSVLIILILLEEQSDLEREGKQRFKRQNMKTNSLF